MAKATKATAPKASKASKAKAVKVAPEQVVETTSVETATLETVVLDNSTSLFGSAPISAEQNEAEVAEEIKAGDHAPAQEVVAEANTVPIADVIAAVADAIAKRTVEKNRETRNGVTRPSAGGLCRAVWDYCDSVQENGTIPTAADVKRYADVMGWNKNNAQIELYQWRKFMGIRGRVAKVVPKAEA